MDDYIKREDALNTFSNAFYSGLAAKIKSIPTADVAPVRHGRWEAIEWWMNPSEEIIIGRVYQCSECKRIIDLEHDETLNDYPYCHCGAKMDGEIK